MIPRRPFEAFTAPFRDPLGADRWSDGRFQLIAGTSEDSARLVAEGLFRKSTSDEEGEVTLLKVLQNVTLPT